MQISTILIGILGDYEHVVVVITASRQPYDLVGVTTVLLDVESKQRDVLLELNSIAVTFIVGL